jgi:hypothetical protein
MNPFEKFTFKKNTQEKNESSKKQIETEDKKPKDMTKVWDLKKEFPQVYNKWAYIQNPPIFFQDEKLKESLSKPKEEVQIPEEEVRKPKDKVERTSLVWKIDVTIKKWIQAESSRRLAINKADKTAYPGRILEEIFHLGVTDFKKKYNIEQNELSTSGD